MKSVFGQCCKSFQRRMVTVAHLADSGVVRRRKLSVIGSFGTTQQESVTGHSGVREVGHHQTGGFATSVDSGNDMKNVSEHTENQDAEEEVSDEGSIVNGIEEPPLEKDILDVDVRFVQLVLREAFRSLDEVDVCQIFKRRATVMKSVPWCIRGLFRSALKLTLLNCWLRA